MVPHRHRVTWLTPGIASLVDARIRVHLLPQPRGRAYLTTVTGQ